MDKRPLIVFSGGMDSTYMLMQALQEGDVYTCYIKANQHPSKSIIELEARKKIIAFLEDSTKHKVIKDTIIDLGDSLFNLTVPDVTWAQAYIWLFGLMFVSDGERHSKICIGNVLGDSIACRLANMQTAWNETQKFSKRISVPLEFPLELTTKSTILEYLPVDLLPNLWVCELPKTRYHEGEPLEYRPCENCAACTTMLSTIWQWESRHKENFKDSVLRRIKENKEMTPIPDNIKKKPRHPRYSVHRNLSRW